MRVLGTRHDEQPRGVAVEAMDDSGALGLVSAGDRVREEAVDERPFRVPGGRVDDHAGGLVHDEQVLVLPDDLERDGVVGHERARNRRRRLVRQLLPAFEPLALHARLHAVDRDEAFGEHPLRDRARADVVEHREEPVEPLARRLAAGRSAS